VIFTGFIFAIFVFLNPLKNLQADYSSLDDIQKVILDNVSATYKSASLTIDENVNNECVSIVNTLGLTGNLIVRGIDDVKETKKENDTIYMTKERDERYLTLYFSSAFSENIMQHTTGCRDLERANYTFGALRIERTAMLGKVQELNDAYMQDYDGLRKNLRIGKDFDFYVLDEDRNALINETLSMHKITARETIVREIPLNIMNGNATMYPVIFGLRTWG